MTRSREAKYAGQRSAMLSRTSLRCPRRASHAGRAPAPGSRSAGGVRREQLGLETGLAAVAEPPSRSTASPPSSRPGPATSRCSSRWPPHECPMTYARCQPSASSTATTSATASSIVERALGRRRRQAALLERGDPVAVADLGAERLEVRRTPCPDRRAAAAPAGRRRAPSRRARRRAVQSGPRFPDSNQIFSFFFLPFSFLSPGSASGRRSSARDEAVREHDVAVPALEDQARGPLAELVQRQADRREVDQPRRARVVDSGERDRRGCRRRRAAGRSAGRSRPRR